MATNDDYMILSTQRSGTHLLATLLNSHPKIACYGENREKLPELLKSEGKIRGRIVMYNRFKGYRSRNDINKIKIIHLIRNPFDVARSRWVNSQKKFPGHVREKRDYSIELNYKKIYEMEKVIREEQNRHRTIIKNTDYIEIKYEDISGGRDVVEVDNAATRKILDFLGADRRKLIATIRKPNWKFN